MKKFFSMMAVLAAMFTFVACETPSDEPNEPQQGGKLATPELTETHTPTSFTVAWDAVSGADAYIVNFKGKNTTVTECSFTVEGLNEGTYTVKVKATGANRTDSDLATIQVTITGLTEVDWFTQTLTVLTEPVEVEGQNGPYTVHPHNALEFSWQGTGVVSIAYGMFTAEQVEGMSKSEIKSNLTDVSSYVQYVNADGYVGVIPGLTGSTTYKLYALVTNAEGLEFLAVSEATTAEAVASDAAKAWLGNWTASVDQQYVYGTGFINQPVNLNLTIEMLEGESDVVLVYGYSSLGADFPVFGYIYQGEDGENVLGIMNQSIIGQEGQYYYTWFSYGDFIGGQYDGTQDFMLGEFPAFWLVMSADGNSAESQSNTIKWNSNGDQFKALALGCGGWDGDQNLAFFQDQESGVALPFYSCDVKNVQKSSAAASKASVRNANEFTLTPSIVVSNVYSL